MAESVKPEEKIALTIVFAGSIGTALEALEVLKGYSRSEGAALLNNFAVHATRNGEFRVDIFHDEESIISRPSSSHNPSYLRTGLLKELGGSKRRVTEEPDGSLLVVVNKGYQFD